MAQHSKLQDMTWSVKLKEDLVRLYEDAMEERAGIYLNLWNNSLVLKTFIKLIQTSLNSTSLNSYAFMQHFHY